MYGHANWSAGCLLQQDVLSCLNASSMSVYFFSFVENLSTKSGYARDAKTHVEVICAHGGCMLHAALCFHDVMTYHSMIYYGAHLTYIFRRIRVERMCLQPSVTIRRLLTRVAPNSNLMHKKVLCITLLQSGFSDQSCHSIPRTLLFFAQQSSS